MEKFETHHTPGPWRFEVHETGKDVKLCGGVPKYDLTVLDFRRWGMQGGQARFREPEKDGFNIMRDTLHWAVVVPGREHHASWFKGIKHPDAQLIEAAPLLLSALIKAVEAEDCKKGIYSLLDSPYVAPNWYDEAKAAIQAAISQPENVKP